MTLAMQMSKQITELQTHSIEVEHAINNVYVMLPKIQHFLNKLQTDMLLMVNELDVKMKINNLRQSLADSITGMTYSLHEASKGRCVSTLLSDADADAIRDIYHNDKQTYDIDTTRDTTLIQVIHPPGRIIIVYSFPQIDRDRQGVLFKVHKIPRFEKERRLIPNIVTPNVVIMLHSSRYVLLDSQEAADCVAAPKACKSSQPIMEMAENVCGVSNYFMLPAGCTYSASNDMSNFFLTIQNRSIYSLSVKSMLYSHCPGTESAGADQLDVLETMGTFETKPGCYATMGEATIIPSNAQQISLDSAPALVQIQPTVVRRLELELKDSSSSTYGAPVFDLGMKYTNISHNFDTSVGIHQIVGTHSGYISLGVLGVFAVATMLGCCYFGCHSRLRSFMRRGSGMAVRYARYSRRQERVNIPMEEDYEEAAAAKIRRSYRMPTRSLPAEMPFVIISEKPPHEQQRRHSQQQQQQLLETRDHTGQLLQPSAPYRDGQLIVDADRQNFYSPLEYGEKAKALFEANFGGEPNIQQQSRPAMACPTPGQD